MANPKRLYNWINKPNFGMFSSIRLCISEKFVNFAIRHRVRFEHVAPKTTTVWNANGLIVV